MAKIQMYAALCTQVLKSFAGFSFFTLFAIDLIFLKALLINLILRNVECITALLHSCTAHDILKEMLHSD